MRFSFGSMPLRAALVERADAFGQQLRGFQHVVQHDRLVDVELEVALRARERHRVIVAEHLHGDHGERLALGRVDLARHDRGARLVLRDLQLGEAGARAAGVEAHVVGDLHQRAGERAHGRAGIDQLVVRGQRRELVRRREERLAGFLRDPSRRHLAEARIGVEPGADGGAADREGVHALDRLARSRRGVIELRHPARDRLAERERRRVLQVGAARP